MQTGASASVTVVEQAVQHVLHLVLHPRNTVEEAWLAVHAELENRCQQEITQDWLRRLMEMVEQMNLTEGEARDTASCTVLRKILKILDSIIAKYPPEVQERARAKFAEIESSSVVPGWTPNPTPQPSVPGAASGNASSSSSPSVAEPWRFQPQTLGGAAHKRRKLLPPARGPQQSGGRRNLFGHR